MPTLQCEICGKYFTPDDSNDIYCSEICLDIANEAYDDDCEYDDSEYEE